MNKLELRDVTCYKKLLHINEIEANPIFKAEPGPKYGWEKALIE